MKKICLLGLVLITVTLSGCAYDEGYAVSVPTTAEGKSRGKRDINYSQIKYSDLSLHVRLLNDINTDRIFSVVIVPVYIGLKNHQKLGFNRYCEPYDLNSEFRILVAMLPKDTEYSLNAEEVTLSIDGVTFTASGIEGPVRYDPYISHHLFYGINPSIEQQTKKVGQGYIFSLPLKEGPKRVVGINNMNVDVPKTGLWSCFELIFNCATPSPEQDIKLDLDGVMQRGVMIDIPVIKFKKSRLNVGQSLPF